MNMADQTKANNNSSHPFGISTALGTPFSSDGSIDITRAVKHANHVLSIGASSVTLFGTTGEGASLGLSEQTELLDAMISAGISPDKIIATICSASLTDAQNQALTFMERGVKRMLIAPPYYFNGISEDALFAWYSEFAKAVLAGKPELILYNIPQVTDVPVTAPLIRRLQDQFGKLIFGVKDSSGNWDSTATLLKIEGLAVMVGDERHLARASRLGAAGAISGVANLFPDRMSAVLTTGKDDPKINSFADDLVKLPVTAAIKAMIGSLHQQSDWIRMRPPLESIPKADIANLATHLSGLKAQDAG